MKIDPDCQNTTVEIAFSKNSQKAQSGDYGNWAVTFVSCLAKKCTHKHARM